MSSIPTRAVNKIKRITLENTSSLRGAVPAIIVGGGRISPVHIAGYRDSVIAYPAAVCDVSPAALGSCLTRQKNVKGFLDLDTALEQTKPVIASVCTWPQHHLQIVEKLIDGGVKGILCEKPLTLRLDEATRMAEICERNDVKLGGSHQYRFHEGFRFAKDAVKSGQLGDSIRVEGCIGSTLANNGPHLIDSIRFILGDRDIESVSCKCYRESDLVNRNYPAEESSEGVINFQGGITASIITGELASEFFEIRIIGDRAQISVSPAGVRGDLPGAKLSKNPKHAHPQMFREFAKWVVGKQSHFAADANSSVATVEVVAALYESARTGTPINIPLQNQGDVIKQLYPFESESTSAPNVLQFIKPEKASQLVAHGGKRIVTYGFPSGPIFGQSEVAAVGKVIRSGQLGSTGGKEVKAFEKEMARMYGSPDAVTSTSGTASIHVALAAVNPEPSDEVITTPITDMGSIIPILACNCVPAFADVDPVTGNITAATIEKAITSKTKAVILVHLFGRPADLGPIKELLDNKGIALIEDCAQAHYADTKLGKIGTVGDFGCFSLQQAKHISCGDGGITLINNPECIARARLFVDKGWNRKSAERAHEFFGMNYRMTELQGAVARKQLIRLPGMIKKQRSTAISLRNKLRDIPGIILPEEPEGSNSSWWFFHWMLKENYYLLDPASICGLLCAEGIKAKQGYLLRPMFEEKVLREYATYGRSGFPLLDAGYQTPRIENYPGTKQMLTNSILISWGPRVTDMAVNQMDQAIHRVFESLKTN